MCQPTEGIICSLVFLNLNLNVTSQELYLFILKKVWGKFVLEEAVGKTT